jgi:hypothetical protein
MHTKFDMETVWEEPLGRLRRWENILKIGLAYRL